jgi:hypothetical protein
MCVWFTSHLTFPISGLLLYFTNSCLRLPFLSLARLLVVSVAPSVGNQGTFQAALYHTAAMGSRRLKRSSTSTIGVATIRSSLEKKGREDTTVGNSKLAPALGEMLCLVPARSFGSHFMRWIRSGSGVVRWTKGGSCADVDKLWIPLGSHNSNR